MKKKIMYVKPLMEVVHVEEEAPLAKYSTGGSGGAGHADNGSQNPDFNDSKLFFWSDEIDGDEKFEDDKQGGFSTKTTFAWDDFKKQ